MDQMNSMKNQHYEEEDMPLERQLNSDDALEIDEGNGDCSKGEIGWFYWFSDFAPSGPNHLLESEPSHSIVPYEISDAIVPVDIEEKRPQKRFGIEQEQANAALDLPSTYEEAIRSPDSNEWKKAIQQELQALKEKETWILTSKTPNMKVIGAKWVFIIKRNEFGEVESIWQDLSLWATDKNMEWIIWTLMRQLQT
uniref:AlNc14C397G11339 protein n=1 Tax=Albugo laibachii Nc14 TaxID=890382 RepID=F0WYS9_9STRA|nr:AlNc14C397G11339 [Albugo laibachii Nc14]|eukprot:CCA26638.1 AlNc14C397G11339 [Albugo laibachii Nc14]